MLLIALPACLLARDKAADTRDPWQRRPAWRRSLRNVFDLSVRPARRREFVARCLLLVLCAVVFNALGAGAALFIQAAPVLALVLVGALAGLGAMSWISRD